MVVLVVAAEVEVEVEKGAGILGNIFSDILPNRAMMGGTTFRRLVQDYDAEGVAIFRHDTFDEVWPFLRVLARSPPWGKQTSAKGLQKSMLFVDKEKAEGLKVHQGITIFFDQQVVAMTCDGANDAQPRSCRHRFRHGHPRHADCKGRCGLHLAR